MVMTRKFRNAVRIEGEVAYISVKRKGKYIEFIVDADQLPKIMSLGLSVTYVGNDKHLYGSFKADGKVILLHRFLTGAKESDIVDHWNNNTLDNRLANLKVGTQGDNLSNPNSNFTTNSGHKNIYWRKEEGSFYIKLIRGGKLYTKRERTIEAAVEWRDQKLEELA